MESCYHKIRNSSQKHSASKILAVKSLLRKVLLMIFIKLFQNGNIFYLTM